MPIIDDTDVDVIHGHSFHHVKGLDFKMMLILFVKDQLGISLDSIYER